MVVFIYSCTARVLNTSQIPQIPDDNAWQTVSNDNLYPDKPITNKKMSKREVSTKSVLIFFILKLF